MTHFPPARPPVKSAATKKNEPRGTPHAFDRDVGLPLDFKDRATCRCGLVGEQGDAHHPDGALPLSSLVFPPVPPEDRSKEITGERDQGSAA